MKIKYSTITIDVNVWDENEDTPIKWLTIRENVDIWHEVARKQACETSMWDERKQQGRKNDDGTH